MQITQSKSCFRFDIFVACEQCLTALGSGIFSNSAEARIKTILYTVNCVPFSHSTSVTDRQTDGQP